MLSVVYGNSFVKFGTYTPTPEYINTVSSKLFKEKKNKSLLTAVMYIAVHTFFVETVYGTCGNLQRSALTTGEHMIVRRGYDMRVRNIHCTRESREVAVSI